MRLHKEGARHDGAPKVEVLAAGCLIQLTRERRARPLAPQALHPLGAADGHVDTGEAAFGVIRVIVHLGRPDGAVQMNVDVTLAGDQGLWAEQGALDGRQVAHLPAQRTRGGGVVPGGALWAGAALAGAKAVEPPVAS